MHMDGLRVGLEGRDTGIASPEIGGRRLEYERIGGHVVVLRVSIDHICLGFLYNQPKIKKAQRVVTKITSSLTLFVSEKVVVCITD
jgi:hypothetical protein